MSKIKKITRKKTLKVPSKRKNLTMFEEHKDLFLGLIGVFIMTIASLFGNTEWFKASILQIPEPFDGTIMPIEKEPNWFTWGGNNKTTKYSEIDKQNLIKVSKYSASVGGVPPSSIRENGAEKQAKLTYSIVYLGNYDLRNRNEGLGSHLAVDVRIPSGTPIRAIANGKIVKVAQRSAGFGKHLVLKIPNAPDFKNPGKKTTYYAAYNHLSLISVKDGQVVKRGDIIGKSGNSGISTTPHLHFQIDTKDAPWHPYWPFTGKEALTANLTFFSAVREGLGKDRAEKFTINPFKWIEKHLNENFPLKNKAKKVKIKDDFGNFQLDGNKDFNVGEKIQITILAKDKNGQVMSNFVSSSDISISTNSNTAKISKILNFSSGIAKISVENEQAEDFFIEIKKGEKSFTKIMSSKNKTVAKAIVEKQIPEKVVENNLEKKVKEKIVEKIITENVPEHLRRVDSNYNILIQGNSKMKVGEKQILKVYLTEKTGAFREAKRDFYVHFNGIGKIRPQILTKGDFLNSKGIIQFTATKAGNAKIKINGEKFKIQISEKKVENRKIVEKIPEEKLHSSAPINIFTDVYPSHTNYEAIKFLKEKGIIGGYKDGSFKANKIVSRVESLKMIFGALNISTEGANTINFPDTENGIWYSNFIGKAVEKGIAKGYPDGKFKPSKSVNRSEFYKILAISASINPSVPLQDPYFDVPKDSWFGKYINFAKEAKLRDSGQYFFPSDGVSRAEVAESLFRLIKFLGK